MMIEYARRKPCSLFLQFFLYSNYIFTSVSLCVNFVKNGSFFSEFDRRFLFGPKQFLNSNCKQGINLILISLIARFFWVFILCKKMTLAIISCFD